MFPLRRFAPMPAVYTIRAGTTSDADTCQVTNEVPYVRKRATDIQIQVLHDVFGRKPYPTREERNALARDIGMEYKSVTVWFQNKRQSAKRKAWTRNSRARLRAQAGYYAKAPVLKTSISLDCVASMSRKPSNSPESPSFIPTVLPRTPRGKGKRLPYMPASAKQNDLWRCLPSSPPECPSSPAVEVFQLSPQAVRGKLAKTLEWACAKDRAERKHRRGKENRPPRLLSGYLRQRAEYKSKVKEMRAEVNRKDGDRIRVEDHMDVRHKNYAEPSSQDTHTSTPDQEEVQAAMVLLDFMKRQ